MALSHVVFWDIQCRKISRPWNPSKEPIEVIESGTIRQTGYIFLLVFYSNFVPKFFFRYSTSKMPWLENRVRGPSRSLKDRAHMTSYWRSIVNMVLSLVVSEIVHVEKYRDLEITVRCQSRSLKVVPFDTLDMVSYYIVLCSNFVRFWDIRFQKCRDLENRVRGPLRSL